MICFTEVRFLQTYSPLRWSQRPGLFQPFSSLKRSLRPSELLFSIKREHNQTEHKVPARTTTQLVSLSLVTIEFDHKNEWERKEAIQAQEVKWTQVLLSLVTIWFGVIPDLGEDLISLVVSTIECYSSCNVLKGGKLGCNWMWGGGGIYSPNHQTSRLVEAAVAWRTGQSGAPPDTVQCASHVTPALGLDLWSSDWWGLWDIRWCTGQLL
jgi:hypothetical protein